MGARAATWEDFSAPGEPREIFECPDALLRVDVSDSELAHAIAHARQPLREHGELRAHACRVHVLVGEDHIPRLCYVFGFVPETNI